MPRSKPNILICGTPGVGKSTLCEEISKDSNIQWLDANKVAKSKGCIHGYDSSFECDILDEDKLLDELEPIMEAGGVMLEYHSCEFFPERWFDAVFVLSTNNTILYDRLHRRGYNELKISKNVECEIFQSTLEEAKESYKESVVHPLESNTDRDMEKNIKYVQQWIQSWKP